MIKIAFTQYTPRQNGKRSIEEAISEVQREMDVRKRIMDRWVADGKVSWVEAHDRLERHMSALRWLIQYSQEMDQAQQEASQDTSTPFLSEAEKPLDTPAAEQAA